MLRCNHKAILLTLLLVVAGFVYASEKDPIKTDKVHIVQETRIVSVVITKEQWHGWRVQLGKEIVPGYFLTRFFVTGPVPKSDKFYATVVIQSRPSDYQEQPPAAEPEQPVRPQATETPDRFTI